MRRSSALFSLVLVSLFTVVSCSQPTALPPSPSTATTLPPTIAIIPPTETSAPTTIPTETPTELPSATPAGSEYYLPVGIATIPTGGGTVNFFDLQGGSLGSYLSPNLAAGLFQQAAISGKLTYSPGPILPSVIYFTMEQGGEIWQNAQNNAAGLVAAPNLLNLIGAPGKLAVAYSLVSYTDYGLESMLYVGEPQSLASAQPVLDTTSTEIYAVKPMAIAFKDEQPVGIWYTMMPYGIGGDIVFDPHKTLVYLDLSNNKMDTYLDQTQNPQGISPDQTWIAYTPVGGAGPLTIAHQFDYANAISFPLKENSDRGSGDAIFSPDGQLVAWIEASGSIMSDSPNFHQTIRIASTTGTVISEIPDSALVEVSGLPQVQWIRPLGFLDNNTLALEVKGAEWDVSSILTVKSDGTGITYLASGTFLGFLYP